MSEKRRTRQKWTHDELAILTAHYAKMGPSWEGWADLLPRRSKVSIEHAAKRLHITKYRASPMGHMPDAKNIPATRGSWTEEELRILDREYPSHGHDWDGWSELLPGRSTAQIRLVATQRSWCRPWTPEDDLRLWQALQVISDKLVADPREVAEAIQKVA
jgi:hypothetical protein